jgi:N-acetyl-alpha-D-muramate 1-phosphate uridylyltransferase
VQVALLAGGLATRLRPITQTIPKSMVPLAGKPFLQYQLELLRARGVADVVLCVGHLADQIEAYFGDGRDFGVRIRYSREAERLLGTAGALRKAMELLDETFFVLYGDSYLMFDYPSIMTEFKASRLPAMMVVYRNQHRYDTSNVVIEDGRIAVYDKRQHSEAMVYIDSGLLGFRREVLAALPLDEPASLDGDLLPPLVASRQVLAIETPQRFYEIGSHAGLAELERLVADGGAVG